MRDVRMYNPTHRFPQHRQRGPRSDPPVRWNYQFQNNVYEVAVWDDTVYLAAGQSIVAVGTDGTTRWRFQTDERVKSSPAVVDGTLYVGSHDHNVYALDAASGTERWRFQTDGRVQSSPAVVDGTLYVGSVDNNVYALGEKESGRGTEVYHRSQCSSCEVDLSKYGDVSFCPECGAQIDTSEDSDTQVYDP